MRNAFLLLIALVCLAVVPVRSQDDAKQFWETGNAFLRLALRTKEIKAAQIERLFYLS